MTTEQQNKAWACLPKSERNIIKKDYKSDDEEFDRGWDAALKTFFGLHNITSDTEPEEMLMVERSVIQSVFNENAANIRKGEMYVSDINELVGQNTLLDTLFGDKCLPDKSGKEVNFPTKPDKEGQAKPKFSIGQKVRVIDELVITCGLSTIITEVVIEEDSKVIGYWVDDEIGLYMEYQLEPYTEETNADYTLNSHKINNKIDAKTFTKMLDEMIESPEEAPENMKRVDKELNLCELLKGCEGEKFYSRAYGEVTLNEIVRDDRPNSQEIKCYTPDPQSDRIWFLRDGRKYRNGEIDLFPSRALYEKYPLDAKKAWAEWAASKKPWTPKDNEPYWFINNLLNPVSSIYDDEEPEDRARVKVGNFFRTEEEAQQATEEVRKCLESFHKRKEGEK